MIRARTAVLLCAAALGGAVAGTEAEAANRLTFEVTVERTTFVKVDAGSAQLRLRLRVGFVNCRASVLPDASSRTIPQSFVRFVLADGRTLRTRRVGTTALGVLRAGREVRRLTIPTFRCDATVWRRPRLLNRHYTVTVTLRNLRPNSTYYLTPCLSRWGSSRDASIGIRCTSLVTIKTRVNWQSPDVRFVALTVPQGCPANGRTRLRLNLKNAGLGPVTRPFEVWVGWKPAGFAPGAQWTQRKIPVTARIAPGRGVTLFVPITLRFNGAYTATVRIDPQARLSALGENSANNNVGNIAFAGKTGCATGYDLALSSIRFRGRQSCSRWIRFTLSNRMQSRVPLLQIPVRVEMWVGHALVKSAVTRYPNTLKRRRSVTLTQVAPRLPTNRPFKLRVRLTVLPNGSRVDQSPANNTAERIFRCDLRRL